MSASSQLPQAHPSWEMNPQPDLENSIENKLKAEAKRLGFSLCGITSADPPEHFGKYENWIRNDLHADMHYLSGSQQMDARKKPLTLLPGLKSIISLAWSYPVRPISGTSNLGQVAGYVSSVDYHLNLNNKSTELAEYLKTDVTNDIKYKVFTDSAPILERELFSRAGLGWVGKNSCVLSPVIGSAFLISEIFVDYPLAADLPFTRDYCGKCERCIKACPTHCILPDRTTDSRRCISYQTIENRGQIPEDIRSKLGNWLFGCDICQSVCPWNQKMISKNAESQLIDFQGSEVVNFLEMSPSEFKLQFQDSAILRAKWEGFIRNVLIFLVNQKQVGTISAVRGLIPKLTSPMLIETANWAISRLEKSK
jgi:epoxyqueuosine reductase